MNSHDRRSSRRGVRARVSLVIGLVLPVAVLPAAARGATRTVPYDHTSAPLCQVDGGAEGRVQSAVVLGDTLYFSGKFTKVAAPGGGPEVVRNRLAACRLSTGELLPWNPNADNWVFALATDGARIYAGGIFRTVGGMQAVGLVALDPVTGAPDPAWRARAGGGGVRALTVHGPRIYVGGSFTSINGEARAGIAAVDRATGGLDRWDPDRSWDIEDPLAGHEVRAFAVAGSKVVIAEYASNDHLFALDATTAEEVSWRTKPDYPILALAASGDQVFAAGGGLGGSRNTVLGMSASDGRQKWELNGDGNVQAVAVVDGIVYAGGHFQNIDGKVRDRLLAATADSGSLLSWDAGVDQTADGVYALVPTPSGLVATGEFQFVSHRRQQGVAFFPGFGVSSVSPGSVPKGTTQTMRLTGAGFGAAPAVNLGPGITVASVRRVSGMVLDVTATVAPEAATGPRTVTVTDPARGSARCANCLMVGAPAAGGPPPGAQPGTSGITPGPGGYRLIARDGGIFSFGDATYHGSAGDIALNAPIVGSAATPSGDGYWLVASDGGIFTFGDATFRGSTGDLRLARPIVGMTATPSGKGYWLVASDGGIFAFGDAVFHGSTGAVALARPIVGMTATPSGKGYWLVASDGGIFAFGDAVFHGSTGAIALARPIVGMTATPSGKGYLLAASDGGLFAFGDAVFRGSTGALKLVSPIVGMAASASGNGYWLVAADGGLFAFGDAPFKGSTGHVALAQPIIGMIR